ncbi:hypothetical protein L6R53_13330 [Myxococcota bacterium]|nr:hypothetical protein [Myxococcota bacterium]
MIPLLSLLLACGDSGEDSGSTDALCQDAPVVTWEYWGQGFLTESCQSCHASTSADRNGAPASVTFDTEAQVWTHRDAILATATGAEPTMPPRGGPSPDDRDLLEIWLRCWLEEP